MSCTDFFPTRNVCCAMLAVGVMATFACGESGIRIKSGPTQLTAGNPPCNAERITTFKMVIENINYTCNEWVRITKALPDSGDMEPNSSPFGSFEFLGFKTSEGGTLQDEINYDDMEDESTNTFFFDVRTFPKEHETLGSLCDFEFAEFGIRVCDHDGGCDWGVSADLPCPIGEKPTPFVTKVRLDADATLCPPSDTGTGTIRGKITTNLGTPAANARVVARRVLAGEVGCKGAPEFATETVFAKSTPWAERGQYEITGLPFPPGDYEVTARDSGRCAQATVTIPGGGSVVLDLTLMQSCP